MRSEKLKSPVDGILQSAVYFGGNVVHKNPDGSLTPIEYPPLITDTGVGSKMVGGTLTAPIGCPVRLFGITYLDETGTTESKLGNFDLPGGLSFSAPISAFRPHDNMYIFGFSIHGGKL